MEKPRHKDDFVSLYDLHDPGPYYRGLEPADYRMPEVLSGFLRARGSRIKAARRTSGALKALDMGCGYGAVGTTLRFDVGMRDLFRYHAGHEEEIRGSDAFEADSGFLSARRRPDSPDMTIAGLDIAGHALRYAANIGAIDLYFKDDLIAGAPSDGLKVFLSETDMILESGALAILYEPGFRKSIEVAAPNRPWIVFCPRPDADRGPALAVLEDLEYRIETLLAPMDYRRCLSDMERDQVGKAAEFLGRSGESAIKNGYIQTPILLCRPKDALDISVDDLRGDWRPGTHPTAG